MNNSNKIGITERGDAALNLDWIPWVRAGRPAILITKDPHTLYGVLAGTDSPLRPCNTEVNVIVHCTITGFGGTILEPNVPQYKEALQSYWHLIDFLGPDRVVLRIDPIIPTQKGINTARKVLVEASKSTRVRISFIDNYDHVKRRMLAAGIPLSWVGLHAPLENRLNAWVELTKLRPGIEICGEPGFQCTGCVSAKDCEVLSVHDKASVMSRKSSQRQYCACLAYKHELLKNRSRCSHQCIYCYWL